MADFVSRINRTTPSYPVRPVQPTPKERDPSGRRNKKPDTEAGTGGDGEPGEQTDAPPTIDEHV